MGGGLDWGGKAGGAFLRRYAFGSLGAPRRGVLVGPGEGLDNAMISAGSGRVLVVTCDPVSLIPSVGIRNSAMMSVHLAASDYSTSGALPQFAVFAYNFPPEMRERDAAAFLRSVGDECRKLGVAVVGGHTGSYDGAAPTVIGACTMFGLSKRGNVVSPRMARPGDAVLMTKGAAIETTASLAWEHPDPIRAVGGSRLLRRARKYVELCTTVRDSAAAASVGLGREAVTSMHDATEGGVLGALLEMSRASGRAFVVDPKRILVTEEASAVCSAFGIDPLRSLSEGTLLITCAGRAARVVRAALASVGIECRPIGRVESGTGVWTVGPGGRRAVRPGPDPYWSAFKDGRPGSHDQHSRRAARTA
jgi:hydrogenase expression/formation protein HypE